MMQRICPVCDQVMKHAHYCSACHSWVKDPVYMNVTYYLNERHPKNEAHCSYHNGEHHFRTWKMKNAACGFIRTESAQSSHRIIEKREELYL